MDTNSKTPKEEAGSLLQTAAILFAWIAIVLAWRSFVGSDGGVLWLVHRLFG